MFCSDFDAFCAALQKRGYIVHTAGGGGQAKAIALDLIGAGSVGCGGSMSAVEIGLLDALRAQGNVLYDHQNTPRPERPAVFKGAAASDWYLCSTNAITRDCKLVNLDSTGNRVSGMFFGPKRVLLVIGKNKFVETLDAAEQRIHEVAAPLNAKRLGRNTPCVQTGKCADCYSPERICRVMSVISMPPGGLEAMHLLLVDEALGY